MPHMPLTALRCGLTRHPQREGVHRASTRPRRRGKYRPATTPSGLPPRGREACHSRHAFSTAQLPHSVNASLRATGHPSKARSWSWCCPLHAAPSNCGGVRISCSTLTHNHPGLHVVVALRGTQTPIRGGSPQPYRQPALSVRDSYTAHQHGRAGCRTPPPLPREVLRTHRCKCRLRHQLHLRPITAHSWRPFTRVVVPLHAA
jgi:hypothetical protein